MQRSLTQSDILRVYWPLAASWLMMGLEMPLVSAVVARLADPEIHLAAYGGIVFPIALLVEAPIIMLLAASTALSRDRASYEKLRRFMVVSALGLTALHALIAATPLYDVLAERILDAPEPIREPGRIGLLLMIPWAGSIAYRRFQQGVLIRFGHSRTVGIGTAVRLAANATVLAAGLVSGDVPGIVVGAGAVAVGVVAEAIFIGLAVRPVLRRELPDNDPEARPLTRFTFLRFYTPLALTSLITLLALPLGSAAMGRMPLALSSLAAWPVLNGLTFTMRSLGFAYSEVVVSLLDREGAFRELRTFALRLAATVSGLLLLIAATPLARLWFDGVSGLPADLSDLAHRALWIAIPLPAASVLVSALTGLLVNRHHTRAVSEAVSLHILAISIVLGVGIAWQGSPGLLVSVSGTLTAALVQFGWLLRSARGREAVPAEATVPSRPER